MPTVAFTWDVLVTDALLASMARAAGLETAEALESMSATIARILGQTGGVPIAQQSYSDEQRTRIARDLLHEGVKRLLGVLGSPTAAPGYFDDDTGIPEVDRVIVARERVPVNRADRRSLESLPGIDRVVAGRVIEERKAGGPFASVADLAERVDGIGETRGAQLAGAIEFDIPADLKKAAYRVTGDFERDFARLVELQPGESAEDRILAALDLLSSQIAVAPHPCTRFAHVRDFPSLPPIEVEADWIGILSGSEYFHVLPELLAAARTTVEIAMFHIAFPSERHPTRNLLEAVVSAIERGVSVRVLLDRDRPSDVYRSTVINSAAAEFLEAGGASVKFDPEERLLHSKFVVIDGVRTIIGSHNWSAGSYFHFDDVSLVVESESFARDVRSRFDRLWAGT